MARRKDPVIPDALLDQLADIVPPLRAGSQRCHTSIGPGASLGASRFK